MVTGIEAAGLALAILPLFVNQIDGYVRGIEKIKALRRYRREFKAYSVGLRTQHAILLNTLEQTLEGVVDDEDQVAELICNPQGEGWRDPGFQKRLRRRLDRNYEVFMGNMAGLSELLEQLSHKMDINGSDIQTPATDVWNILKFRKILSKAVYDDLLVKIDGTNTILKTLVDQSFYLEDTKKRRKGWNHLLKRYQKARKHADGLFKAIIGGNYWRCQCKTHHCVHVQLQINSLQSIEKYPDRDSDARSQFQMIFANTMEDLACLWTWTEVVFEPWQVEETVPVSSSRHDDPKSNGQKKPTVQFHVPAEEVRPLEKRKEALSAPPIEDFCSSLCVAESYVGRRESIGCISNPGASVRYTMHAVKKLPKCVPQKPLREVLSDISRRDRLHIATALASGMIQMCGNWLKSWWDISDVYLAATSNDECNVSLENLYLSWPVSTTCTVPGPVNGKYCHSGDNSLLPLGLALVELSLGKPLQTLLGLEDGDQDTLVARFKTASWLVNKVYNESGTNYADVVNSCLSWSSLCLEKRFEERVFDTVVSPLLKDLGNFEGLA
ncbi:unnamed protein product [Penicillium salamii]|uniref:DUF7580 domain-containing protein n=1 Tax=Penicillium salamii TaxID=1612424 RepID=A0A9W4I4T3_9EURO|nr:unnamed protein product [Penicillium salamii]CAG8086232.1 unnamed protein product [Penicillium salamii]CAG8103008.1 unnamed protein product [Penicillium salamii]CAG8103370.1 unnamed protein product [Penicillium salamii]CAG8119543.1 unnamed protein product [Penicillium salamii]